MLSRSWHFISVVVCLRNSKMCAIHKYLPLPPPLSLYLATAPSLCRQIDVVHKSVDMKVDLKNQQQITTISAPTTQLSVCLSASRCQDWSSFIRHIPIPIPIPLFISQSSLSCLYLFFFSFFRRVPEFVSLFNASLNIICELLCHILPRAPTDCILWLSISEGCCPEFATPNILNIYSILFAIFRFLS